MAIQFLNNLNINDNQLLNAKVQVASTAPTAAKGQIYLDSTTNVNTFKYHDGTQWIALKQLNINNSTFINLANLSAAGSNVISLEASLNATGTPSSTTFLRGDNTWGTPIGALYTLPVAAGGANSAVLNLTEQTLSTQIVSSVTLNGTSAGVKITESTGNNGSITIGLQDSITLAGELTVQGTGQSSFAGQVTIPAVPVANTDAASKAYVDASTAGALVFQGGYDAATNTPNLDSPPTGTIKKGFMWTVTVDGTFFTEQVRVGDSLIAKIDTPTTLADWTTVQSNIDLATLTTVGLGNVNAGSNIAVSYSNGTATVSTSFDPSGFVPYTGATGNVDLGYNLLSTGRLHIDGTLANQGSYLGFKQSTTVTTGDAGYTSIYSVGTSTLGFLFNQGGANSKNFIFDASSITTNTPGGRVYTMPNKSGTIALIDDIPNLSYAATISASGTVTHNLNTRDIIIQLYDTVTFETVYADVDRPTVNTVTITFASTPTNPIRVLVQK
jgi:hypothetical protein